MEIHRIGAFTDLRLDSAPAAEGETAAKGARREDAAPRPESLTPAAENESPGQPVESLPAETRQSAESLKARLFARCDQAASGDAAARGPAADAGSSLVADVTDYLRRHPGAEDSLEGISEWSDFQNMPGLDARAEAVAMDRIVLQPEGWTRDGGSAVESGESEEAAGGESGGDDSGRG
jgi:hypothetical protein